MSQIENNTIHKIQLPPTANFPGGVWLQPGLNSVPGLFLEELNAQSVTLWTKVHAHDQFAPDGQVRAHAGTPIDAYEFYPGREALLQFTQPVVIFDAQGNRRRGPQLTIYADDQEPEDRAAWPVDLNGFSLAAAGAFCKACSEADVRQRWLAAARDEKLVALLKAA